MYKISDYASMVADAVRVDAYAAALRRSVTADSIVLDLGAGTGTLALLACQLGARKVFAIESDDAIHLGRAVAKASGLADRIQFIQAISTEVTLPDRASIIVSDMRGVLPLFRRHIPSIVDARQRLLAEGGVLIPRRDSLWAAVVDAPDHYANHVTPWRDRTCGLDLGPVRDMLANTWCGIRLAPDQLLTDSRRLAVLEYQEVEDPDLDVEVTWDVRRAGTGHGLGVWFDTELADGIGFSNEPAGPKVIYGQAFFPFATPVALGAGDSIAARIQADLVGGDYVWRWTIHLGDPQGPHGLSTCCSQSTLRGVPLGAAQLLKGAADHVPVLTTEGEIDLFVLSRMQAAMPLGDIARELLVRFPAAFRDWNAALGRAGDLSRKYSKD